MSIVNDTTSIIRISVRNASILLGGIILIYLASTSHSVHSSLSTFLTKHTNNTLDQHPHSALRKPLTCPDLPGINDVYVILKTGAIGTLEKVPVHFNTTLGCIPNHIIYSDLEETLEGHQIHDALNEVPQEMLDTNPEFDLYRRLKTQGRSGLIPEDTFNETGRDAIGWQLDKWKFLPILEKTWRDRPSTKWFIFMEDDTYVSWPNMLGYLSHLDPHKPFYAGAQMQLGETIFAHGGSGFVISHEGMRLANEKLQAEHKHYDDLTKSEWAGDCVLGALLRDIGASVFWATPNFQGKSPAAMDFSTEENGQTAWCKAALTFHHMKPEEVQELWDFEQHLWMTVGQKIWTYADLYEKMVQENIKARGQTSIAWDNLSDGKSTELALDDHNTTPMGQCRSLCENDPECMQFRVKAGETCETSKKVMLGESMVDMESGWMVNRIEGFKQRLRTCTEVEWMLPQVESQDDAA